MSQIIEVVFEKPNVDQLRMLLSELCGPESMRQFGDVLSTPKDGVVESQVSDIKISDQISLGNPHLRILVYESNNFDLEVNFQLEDVIGGQGAALQTALCRFVSLLAEKTGAAQYFVGLEPASDEETRLCTGRRMGPLMLP